MWQFVGQFLFSVFIDIYVLMGLFVGVEYVLFLYVFDYSCNFEVFVVEGGVIVQDVVGVRVINNLLKRCICWLFVSILLWYIGSSIILFLLQEVFGGKQRVIVVVMGNICFKEYVQWLIINQEDWCIGYVRYCCMCLFEVCDVVVVVGEVEGDILVEIVFVDR